MERLISPNSSTSSKGIQHAGMNQDRSKIDQNNDSQDFELLQQQDDRSKPLNNCLKREKRKRRQFTIPQLLALKTEYERTQYIGRKRRFQLSNETQLSEKTIKIWFQNQRLKHRRELAEADDTQVQTLFTQYSALKSEYGDFEQSFQRLLQQMSSSAQRGPEENQA